MTADPSAPARRWSRAGLGFGLAAALALLAFVVNVVVASLAFRYGWRPPIELGRVHEFLLLGAVAVLTVTAALCREKAREEE